MTRKHFSAIAKVISEIPCPRQRRITALSMVEALRPFNPGFDSHKFLLACNA